MTANHAEGARNSMICHRVMHHKELELAIEDNMIEEFPDKLFQLLFGKSESEPARKVLYSKNYQHAEQRVPQYPVSLEIQCF